MGQLAAGFPVFLQGLHGEVPEQRLSLVPVMPPPLLAAIYLYWPPSSHQSFLSLSGLIFSPCRNAKMTNADAARRMIAPIQCVIRMPQLAALSSGAACRGRYIVNCMLGAVLIRGRSLLQLCRQFGRFLLCQPKRRAAVETASFRHHFENNRIPAPHDLGGLGPFHAADFDRQFNPQQAASVGGLFHDNPFPSSGNGSSLSCPIGYWPVFGCILIRVICQDNLRGKQCSLSSRDPAARRERCPT